MTWRERAAELVERQPAFTGISWEQAYLKIAADHGKALGIWLTGLYPRMSQQEQWLIEDCLDGLRPIVATLYDAAASGDLWLADGDPNVMATECRKAADALNMLFGCLDLFRDLRRDVKEYQQAPGWPELPIVLFDRGRVPAALQWFKKPEVKFANGELHR